MGAEVWLGAGAGGSIGALYVLASWLTVRVAAGRPNQQFLLVFFGGMLARMGLALALMTLALLLAPVRPGALIATFLIVFLIGLAAEVFFIHRRAV